MTPGTSETYKLIEKIKKAHIIDRKYEDMEKEKLTLKHSLGSPKCFLDIPIDQKSTSKRNVHDILLTMMKNHAGDDNGRDGNTFDQRSGYMSSMRVTPHSKKCKATEVTIAPRNFSHSSLSNYSK